MDRERSSKDISPGQDEVNILIAGAGGQGILLMGKLLAQTLLEEGQKVSWLPSYGAEVRGGTCKCMVVASSGEIASPYIFHPDYLIVMNEPSYRKYSSSVREEGIIFYNQSLLSKGNLNSGFRNIGIPATEVALKLGEIKTANMVMLGAFIKYSSLVRIEDLMEVLPGLVRGKEILELDRKAIAEGFNLV